MFKTVAIPPAKLISCFKVFLVFCLAGLMAVAAAKSPNPSRLVLVLAGDQVVEVETDKTLVADILAETGLELQTGERVYPSMDRELPQGRVIIIHRSTPVSITAGGETIETLTTARTVGELLTLENIQADQEMVNLPLEQRLSSGQEIEVVQTARELVTEELAIPADTVYKKDSSLLLGTKKVQTQAQDGAKLITYEVTYHDGTEVARHIVSEELLREPVDGLVLQGTRQVASRGSSGNATEGIASYYGSELHGRGTASGEPFDMHAFTAAHRSLKFGTKVKVTFLKTGKSVIVRINDRGPHVAGRIIDLSAAAAKEIGLYAHGVGKVRLDIVN